MAKKKAPKKKAPKAPAAEGRSKKEINEIKSYLAENGWQNTISEYKISPKELSAIKAGKTYKPKAKKKSTAKKAAKKAPRKNAAKKKAVKKTAKKATKKTGDAPWGYKADGTPRKRPGPGPGKKKTATNASVKKKTGDAPWGYKADGTPRKRPGPGKKKATNASVKKKPAKKKALRRKAVTQPAADATYDEMILDYLLSYRNREGLGISLDEVIVDLTTRVRGAA